MATLVTRNGAPVLTTDIGANNYQIVGIEMRPISGVYLSDLVTLGSASETTLAQLPYNITLDRVYIHGDPAVGSKRGVALNGQGLVVENSYISDFKSTWQDAQAICGWSGPGPFVITNNYIEGSGENLMFGGATPAIPGTIPSDIAITGNHFAKPLSWMPGQPSFQGVAWSVKNILELKNAQRVTISGNVFENNWPGSQDGFAIVFTVRMSGGTTAVVANVTFSNNLIRNTSQGVNLLGKERHK